MSLLACQYSHSQDAEHGAASCQPCSKNVKGQKRCTPAQPVNALSTSKKACVEDANDDDDDDDIQVITSSSLAPRTVQSESLKTKV